MLTIKKKSPKCMVITFDEVRTYTSGEVINFNYVIGVDEEVVTISDKHGKQTVTTKNDLPERE